MTYLTNTAHPVPWRILPLHLMPVSTTTISIILATIESSRKVPASISHFGTTLPVAHLKKQLR